MGREASPDMNREENNRLSSHTIYSLLYIEFPFERNLKTLKRIQKRYPTIHIPYLLYPNISPKHRTLLDNYIFVPIQQTHTPPPPHAGGTNHTITKQSISKTRIKDIPHNNKQYLNQIKTITDSPKDFFTHTPTPPIEEKDKSPLDIIQVITSNQCPPNTIYIASDLSSLIKEETQEDITQEEKNNTAGNGRQPVPQQPNPNPDNTTPACVRIHVSQNDTQNPSSPNPDLSTKTPTYPQVIHNSDKFDKSGVEERAECGVGVGNGVVGSGVSHNRTVYQNATVKRNATYQNATVCHIDTTQQNATLCQSGTDSITSPLIKTNTNPDIVKSLVGKLSQKVPVSVIGTMTGDEAIGFLEGLIRASMGEVGDKCTYRILTGPLKNLHIQVQGSQCMSMSIHSDGVFTGTYSVLGEERTVQVPVSDLERVYETYDIPEDECFTDLCARALSEGTHKALLVDGDFVLQRSFGDYPDLETEGGEHSGGALGFYLTLLRLKELFVEYSIHILWGTSRHQMSWDDDCMSILRSVTYSLSKVGRCRLSLGEWRDNREWCVELGKALGYHVYDHDTRDLDMMAGLIKSLGEMNKIVLYTTEDASFLVDGDKRLSLYCPKVNPKGHSVQILETPEGVTTSLWHCVLEDVSLAIHDHVHDYDEERVLELLNEMEFDRELRYWDRSKRVLQSKW